MHYKRVSNTIHHNSLNIFMNKKILNKREVLKSNFEYILRVLSPHELNDVESLTQQARCRRL